MPCALTADSLAKPHIVQVVFDVPLDRAFDYQSAQPLAVGSRVLAQFGPRKLVGVVVGQRASSPHTLKPIGAVLDALPPLPADWLALGQFAARYYHHPLGQTLFTALPSALRNPPRRPLTAPPLYALTAAGAAWQPKAQAVRQLALLTRLRQGPLGLDEARSLHATHPRLLRDWAQAGWVTQVAAEQAAMTVCPGPALNAEQAEVVAGLDWHGFSATLLDGITGSGKTEVYLQWIARVLAAGRQALVLVPEINLTPQLEARFRARFPHTPTVCLHSHLADGARAQAWLAAWQGRARLVIGTRLAVFTPLPELGLIVVDEEHDGSFKQQDGLRYHARDLAVWRAQQAGVPVVLGSATPSLESVAAVQAGRYRHARLTRRASAAALPTIHLLDIRRQLLDEGIAPAAWQALADGLAAGETSLVFINRRGWAPVLACVDCGWLSSCPHCAARLVLHWQDRRLQCHHCGHHEAIPHACPSCGNPDLKPLGQGTQRIEAALRRQFPQARIARIDRDTVSRRDAWADIDRQVHAGELDMLVGTQMLAKGHDFPSLSRVIVLNADGGLYSADFRAEERLFALLTQVAGRAGRGSLPGQVWVQTQFPDHPLYLALQAHDVPGFAQRLLEARANDGYPPAVFQALLRADAPQLDTAMAFLQQVQQHASQSAGLVLCLGPAPASMARLAGRERAQLLLQSARRAPLHALLSALCAELDAWAKPFGSSLRWSLDVDPQEV